MRTIKERTKQLNELITDSYSEEQAIDAFIYLTVKGRVNGSTTVNNIRKCYRNRELGQLLKRLDPDYFYQYQ